MPRDPVKRLLGYAKDRAKRAGIPFKLTAKDIVIPERCPVLGMELRKGTPSDKRASPSIDRLRPELGYVAGNVRVISHRANLLKNNATAEELRLVLADLSVSNGNRREPDSG